MDVRCERCRAHYVFDDEQVTPDGLTVQCTNCQHVFKVKRKELVVTVPVRPEDVTGTPRRADDVLPRSPATGPGRTQQLPAAPEPPAWLVRQVDGRLVSFTELATLHTWIVERRVSREDQISQGDDRWVRLGELAELTRFFALVDAAHRAPPATPVAKGGTALYPPPPAPLVPPTFAAPFPAPQRPAPPLPAASPASTQLPPQRTQELLPEELAAARGGRRGPALLVGLLLLLAGGAGLYAGWPALSAMIRPPPSAPVVVTPPAPPPPAPVAARVEPKVEPAPEPEPTPVKSPEPIPEPQPRAPAPVASPAPAPPPAAKPPGPKALLAQARALRERGDPTRAVELFGRLVSADPENVEALTGRGLCYLDLGQYHTAEASFQTALAVDPEAADALMGLAETYRSQQRNAEAIAQYERYLRFHPDGDEAAVARNAIASLKE